MAKDTGYDTPEEAATAAMRVAGPKSKKYEHAGVIYKKGDKYYYTAPKGGGDQSVKVKVSYPKGADLVAFYHTHPKGPKSDLFSKQDIEVSDKMGLPYYMGNMRGGDVRVYNPGKTKVNRRGVTSGEILGPIEAPEEPPKKIDTKSPMLTQLREQQEQAAPTGLLARPPE